MLRIHLKTPYQLAILACFPADTSTKRGWIILIQGMSRGKHENKVIKSNTKWYYATFFSDFLFQILRACLRGKDLLLK